MGWQNGFVPIFLYTLGLVVAGMTIAAVSGKLDVNMDAPSLLSPTRDGDFGLGPDPDAVRSAQYVRAHLAATVSGPNGGSSVADGHTSTPHHAFPAVHTRKSETGLPSRSDGESDASGEDHP